MAFIISKFCRRKVVDKSIHTSELKRVLTTLDLTLLGIGSTLGIGIYVLAGAVAKDDSGPAVIISFLVAALASVLAGLCYAEFGARVPKAGSAYVYSYVCVGELIAFIVGWNLIMEYVIGVASVAKGYSGYVDSLANGTMKDAFTSFAPLNVSFLSSYVDFFAFGITLAVTFILAFGVKESSLFNNIFTGLNLIVVAFVVIAGSFFAKPSNWAIDVSTVNTTLLEMETGKKVKLGAGGFAPFGFAGVMKGAATCFYGFVGFDCIATTGEEAKNPQKSIPLAIIFSLLFIFLAYFGISTVITMMVPYYLQDSQAPLPEAFTYVGFPIGKWIVTVGAIFGLSTSLLGSMFPMPRVIYAMASDGVLFKFLAKVNSYTATPLIATLIAGAFGGIMAALFDLESLIDMMSIGTLTAYTLVAVCVLILRYRKDENGSDDDPSITDIPSIATTSSVHKPLSSPWSERIGIFYNAKKEKAPSEATTKYSGIVVFIYCIIASVFCAIAIFGETEIQNCQISFILPLIIFFLLILLSLATLALQPVSRVRLSFKVPLVPLVPGLSILANIYLIMKLSGHTWIRFGLWMLIGFLIYGYCLLSGTTDQSYQKHADELNENKRKYSKVSVHGIDNPTLDLELTNTDKEKIIQNGSPVSGKIVGPSSSSKNTNRKDPNESLSKDIELTSFSEKMDAAEAQADAGNLKHRKQDALPGSSITSTKF